MAIYLGVDIGTTSAKCLAVDEEGKIHALAQYPYPMSHPHPGWAEQDPEDYWKGVVSCVKKCVAECKNASDIVSLAMSTQGDTLLVCDEAGVPLMPAISWMDARAEAEYKELVAEQEESFWYDNTGQSLGTLSSACAIRWLQKNQPELWSKVGKVAYVADYLAFRLTGSFVSDIPNASWTPMFSTKDRAWSTKVMDVLNVSPDQLCGLKESGQPIAPLLPEIASEMGLPSNVMLMSGAFDQTAAAHGAGAVEGRDAVLSCGTAWVMYALSSQSLSDPKKHNPVCCHVKSDQWGMVLPFSGGTTYDWLRKKLAEDGSSQSEGADSLIFIPHLYGEISPGWRSESRGSIVGLTMSHTAKDIEIALMRGLAFETRRNAEAARAAGVKIETIRMVGGATKSPIWPQIIADVLHVRVEICDCPESACYGAARLAAGDASANWGEAGNLMAFTPDPSKKDRMDDLYAKYLSCIEALMPLYR